MQTAGTRSGFTQQKPVGEFANSNTTECSATREDAIAEMEREANVRMKCYDRWVSEGKMTPEEARKRMAGIISAWHYLSDSDQAREALLNEQATKGGK